MCSCVKLDRMMPVIGLLLAAVTAARSGAGQRGWAWKETMTPHFSIQHENTWLPPGLTLGIERIHFRLGMDLGTFSPWMAKERIGLYIYRDLESYVKGEFHPPPWSNGVAIYDRKSVAIPTMRETGQMLRVLSHETTHLLFGSYFREAHRDPPPWLNEGLAMLEEADAPTQPATSQWYQDMVVISPRQWLAMPRFLSISPSRDIPDDKEAVALWYVQAYSVTHFLVRKHSRIQFKAFCAELRAGKTPEEALKSVYHIRTLADFNRLWRAWLSDPAHKRKIAALKDKDRNRGDGVVEKSGRGDSPFHAFTTKAPAPQ